MNSRTLPTERMRWSPGHTTCGTQNQCAVFAKKFHSLVNHFKRDAPLPVNRIPSRNSCCSLQGYVTGSSVLRMIPPRGSQTSAVMQFTCFPMTRFNSPVRRDFLPNSVGHSRNQPNVQGSVTRRHFRSSIIQQIVEA